MSKELSECLGEGNYTPEILSNWKNVEKRMIARGWSQNHLDFVYHTLLCPKGHEQYMSAKSAAEKFFPNISLQTASNNASKCIADFVQQLFIGQRLAEYKQKWEERKQTSKGEITRARLSVEEKARRIAEKELKQAFRSQNGLGDRGKLKPEMAEKWERYKEDYLDNAIKAKKLQLSNEPEAIAV